MREIVLTVNAFKTPQLKMVRIPMIRFILRGWKKVNLPFFFDKPTIQNGSYSSVKGSSLQGWKKVEIAHFLEQITIYNTKEQVLTCRIHSLENMCDYTTPCIQSLWECTKGWLKDIKINILIGLTTVVPPYISMHRVFFK